MLASCCNLIFIDLDFWLFFLRHVHFYRHRRKQKSSQRQIVSLIADPKILNLFATVVSFRPLVQKA